MAQRRYPAEMLPCKFENKLKAFVSIYVYNYITFKAFGIFIF